MEGERGFGQLRVLDFRLKLSASLKIVDKSPWYRKDWG